MWRHGTTSLTGHVSASFGESGNPSRRDAPHSGKTKFCSKRGLRAIDQAVITTPTRRTRNWYTALVTITLSLTVPIHFTFYIYTCICLLLGEEGACDACWCVLAIAKKKCALTPHEKGKLKAEVNCPSLFSEAVLLESLPPRKHSLPLRIG